MEYWNGGRGVEFFDAHCYIDRVLRGVKVKGAEELAVCWKGTLAQGGLHFLSVSVPVHLLQVDIGST